MVSPKNIEGLSQKVVTLVTGRFFERERRVTSRLEIVVTKMNRVVTNWLQSGYSQFSYRGKITGYKVVTLNLAIVVTTITSFWQINNPYSF